MYCQIGESVPSFVIITRPINNVRWPRKEAGLVPNLSDNAPLIGGSTSRIV
jgi:hypothetical protein